MENPRQERTAAKQRANAQRGVSGRKQGRKRRNKAVKVLARTQQQVQRQRTDLHPKTALALLGQYAVSSLDEVRGANLLRTRHLATSSRAAGGAAFGPLLAGTAGDAGRRVVAVPPASTSQDGSGVLADGSRGTHRVAKRRSVRTPVGPSCGLVLDREEHAAQHIRRAGQAPQASPWPGAASVA